MGEIIMTTNIPRLKDHLYYCGTDKQGNITVCKAKMKHGGTKKNK